MADRNPGNPPDRLWTSGLLYWHVTLTNAVRDLEDGMSVLEPGKADSYSVLIVPERTLSAAGCRALPYCAGSLDPSHKISLLHWCSRELWQDQDLSFDGNWVIHTTDSPEAVASKCRHLREWWSKHGRDYPQAWRWWSDDCRSEK